MSERTPIYDTHGDRRSGKVLIFDPADNEMTRQFCSNIKRRIERKWGRTICETVGSSVQNQDFPLLVICCNHSRIGTDIDHALSSLSDIPDEKTAVLVLHMKERHALPLTMPTDGLYDERYTSLGKLVDFAVTSDGETYSCIMNTVGYDKLDSFLDGHLGTRQRGSITTRWCPVACNRRPTKKERVIIILAIIFAGLLVGVIIYLAVR